MLLESINTYTFNKELCLSLLPPYCLYTVYIYLIYS